MKSCRNTRFSESQIYPANYEPSPVHWIEIKQENVFTNHSFREIRKFEWPLQALPVIAQLPPVFKERSRLFHQSRFVLSRGKERHRHVRHSETLYLSCKTC